MLKLEGIIPPVPTPFNVDGSFNEELFKDLIKWYLNVGVNGIAICGSTGEGYALLPDEYLRICGVAVKAVGGKVLVVAGVIVNSLNQALTYGKLAKDSGVNVLMVTPPHYIFTPSEEGLYRYFKTIAEVLNIPITIYNVIPQTPVPLNVMIRLVNDVRLLIGVKQSRGDISGLADIIRAIGGKISVMSAIDDLLYPSLVLGVRGAIAAICTVAPELCIELYELVKEGNHVEALKVHNNLLPIWRVVGQQDMPARVKAALELRGIPAGYPRSPLLPVSSEVRERIKEVLKDVGILG